MTMNPVRDARPVPLRQDSTGQWRVGDSRIPLERVVEYFKAGETPEAIVEAFDTLRLADVYAVLGYYLDHKGEVEEYIREQEVVAQAVRTMIEASQLPRPGFKEELLARKARTESNHVPVETGGALHGRHHPQTQ